MACYEHEFQLEPRLDVEDYHIAHSLEDALNFLQNNSDTKIICGGTVIYDLVEKGVMPRAKYLLDIDRIGLDYIEEREEYWAIGAATKLSGIRADKLLRQDAAYLALWESLQGIQPQIMNVGSVGGEICSAMSYCDLPVAALVLDGRVKTVGGAGERTIPLGDLYLGPFVTAIDEDEMVLELQLPRRQSRTGSAFEKLKFMAADYSIVNAAAVISLDERERCVDSRITVSSNLDLPRRFAKAEAALNGEQVTPALIEAAAKVAAAEFRPLSDCRASADYRKKISKHICETAIERAFERARG